MRDEVLSFIKGLNLGTLAVANDLPFEDSGVPLYLKNARTIYVDRPQKTSETFIRTLGGGAFSSETTTISIYFSLDAKLLIANYDSIVDTLKTTKDVTTIQGINRREVDVQSEYQGDILLTQIDFRFTKLLT
jgi:hypothetical protein